MATVPVISEHIVITPGTCGGKPRIVGHRIPVQNIVICYEHQGMSPDEIVSTFEGISLADVFAALAYYHDHREEIDAGIERDRKFADELEARQPSLSDLALKRIGELHASRRNGDLGHPESPG